MVKQRLFFLCAASLLLLAVMTGETALPADASAEIMEEEKLVALTFDDGPRPLTTGRLLDGLEERGAAATFFLIGKEAAAYPELVERMQKEGHQVGNHTWNHVSLEKADGATVTREVGQSETLLEELLGGGAYWLRPPYGNISDQAKALVTVPLVKWSVDPRDWESRNTAKVVQAVMKNVKPNSVILLHDIYPTSVDAALEIVDALQAKGYTFVTVEELLERNGIVPQAGTLYRSADA